MNSSQPTGRDRPLEIDGRPIDVLIADSGRELIDAVLRTLTDELATYEQLPPEALTGDIADAVERALAIYLATLTSGGLPDGASLDELSESAARRAEERIPLDAVIAAYLIGTQVVVDRISATSSHPEVRDIGAAVVLSLRFLRTVTSIVIERYQLERALMDDVRTRQQQAVLADLLGHTFDADQHRDLALASIYVVLRLAIADNDDERTGGVGGAVASHRKLRRIRAVVDRVAGSDPIGDLDAAGGIVLLPWSSDLDVDAVVAQVASAAGASVHAATATAEAPDGIADAATLTGDILHLVRSTRRPPGTYRLDDVKLALQLGRPGPARAELAATLAPIAGRTDLLDTLRAFLDRGMNRRRAALDLGVHPNTVDNRLRKVAERTGVDPTDPTQALALAAALTAHDCEIGDHP